MFMLEVLRTDNTEEHKGSRIEDWFKKAKKRKMLSSPKQGSIIESPSIRLLNEFSKRFFLPG